MSSFALLPALALFLGALGLFAATPAKAQVALTGLSLSVGTQTITLSPAFATATRSYAITVASNLRSIDVTATWTGTCNSCVAGWSADGSNFFGGDILASGMKTTVATTANFQYLIISLGGLNYVVQVNRLTAPTLVPGDKRLTASWTIPGDSYELQYKETGAPDQEDLVTGADPARGWINHAQRLARDRYVTDIRKKSAVIRGDYVGDKPKGLKPGTSYDVRLRVTTGGTGSAWSPVARATTLGTKPEPEKPTRTHTNPTSGLAPSKEQTLLTATLTVGGTSRYFGCDDTYAPVPNCSAALTTNSFTHEGTANTAIRLYIDTNDANVELTLAYGTAISEANGRRLTLHVDGKSFPFANGNRVTAQATEWTNTGLTWTAGQRVKVRLTARPWTGVVLESSSFVPGSEGQKDLIVPEGGSATFGVKLSKAPTANVTVNLSKFAPDAIHGDVNAATVSPKTLTFTSSNWSQAQTVTVTGVQDGNSDHEHLIIMVSPSSTDTDYAGPDAVEGVFVTVSDGGGAVQVGAWPAIGREAGNGATRNVPVTVWLSRAASGTVRVNYATANGTATAGSDYTAVSGSVTFAAGQTRKTVNVRILDDNVEDSGERFYLVLSNPTGASLEPEYTRAVVSIRNDEAHLDGLSVEGAPGAGGPWTKLDLGAFAAETTAYAVTVPHGTTHARLAPVSADEDLTLRAGSGTALTRVRSGQSGPAVALTVGNNVLVVKTTAGTGVEKTYRVTVTRQAATVTTVQTQEPPAQDADLLTRMYSWRNDPQWVAHKSHTDRWDRALLAMGETVSDSSLTPMTAAEAQAFADTPWGERWVPVAAALKAIEASNQQDDNVEPTDQADGPDQNAVPPPPALHATLIGQMNGWRNDPQWVAHKSHTDRWDRALLALGEPVSDASLTPMTDQEAQDFADTAWGERWVPVAAALKTVVTGTSGADTLTGTGNGELLVGLGGADDLSAQGGDDELRGGNGDDDLTGGGGSDRFVFFSGETGAKAITDFASGDVIVLKGDGWSSVADIIAGVQAVGSNGYRYTLAGGLTVETTNNRTLRSEDFVSE